MYYINGEIVENGLINIDEGIFFGLGVFETILVTDKPIFLDEHLHRLNTGLKNIGVSRYIKKTKILEVIKEMNCKDCAIRITVTERNIIISKRDIPYTKDNYYLGFKLGVSDIIRNSTSPLTYIKSISYGDNILAKRQAQKIGLNELIFLNEKNEITEGTVSNIFFIKDNKIFTPAVKCGLLNGIVRQWVINNYDVEEGCYSLQDLYDCQEIFLTNSLMGIMPVKQFNENQFGKEITLDIIKKYERVIDKDVIK